MSQNYDPQDSYPPGSASISGDQSKSDGWSGKSDPLSHTLNPPGDNIFAKWVKVVFRPGIATFSSEADDANWFTTITSILLQVALFDLIFLVQGWLLGISPLQFFVILGLILYTIWLFISLIIVLFISSGLLYLLAKTVGQGRGDFTTQTCLYSLYIPPLSIISVLIGFIPVIGPYLAIVMGIYQLFLTYYMLQAAHKMTPRRAIVVTLIDFIVLIPSSVFAVLVIIPAYINLLATA